MMPPADLNSENGANVDTSFVRYRNCLLAQATLSDLYVEHYLHLAANKLHIEPDHDRIFKSALAAFVLHCAARPRSETTAWTLNFQQPLINCFLVADNELGSVAGRVFTRNVKEADHNLFFSEVVVGARPVRRSAVHFEGSDPFRAVERFYEQSEQRPARYFHLAEETFAMLCAHPDYDRAWFAGIGAAVIANLEERETLAPIERRLYHWDCGCNQQRILDVLAPGMREDPEELFGAEEALDVECPRCAARYTITRETMEAHVARDE